MRPVWLLLPVLLCFAFGPSAHAKDTETHLFAPPPRTISDIAAIFDQEKPDPIAIAKMKAEANAEPPPETPGAVLAEFHYTRAHARIVLGRTHDAIQDAEKAVQVGRGTASIKRFYRFKQFEFLVHKWSGNYKHALELCMTFAREVNRPGLRGWQFNAFRQIVEMFIILGDVEQAETYARRVKTLTVEFQGWQNGAGRRNAWMADATEAEARILETQGRLALAEAAWKRSEIFSAKAEEDFFHIQEKSPLTDLQSRTNTIIGWEGLNLARQGRLAEAEFEARRSLLRHLRTTGKYSALTPGILNRLAAVLVQQGRYAEAEALFRISLDVLRELDVSPEAQTLATTLGQRAAVLNMQRRYREAAEVYAQLDKAIEHWSATERQTVELNADRIYVLFVTGGIVRGLEAARALLAREQARSGEKGFETGIARGILAIGLSHAGQDAEALAEFRRAMPLILAAPEDRDYDDTAWVSARTDRVRTIAEAYLSLATRMDGKEINGDETFPIADFVRSQAVHRSVAAASARAIIRDAGLSALARQEQDEAKRVIANLALLDSAIAMPPEQRDEKATARLRAMVKTAQSAHLKTRAELDQRFKGYSQLLLPSPPAVTGLQASLKEGEALLSFYFGEKESFVWALPKRGKVAFAAIPMTANELEEKVNALRLPMTTPAAYLKDTPPFDTKLAYSLYKSLLQPVESGWISAGTLFVVANGALGVLPLAVLPVEQPPSDTQGNIPFANYRQVRWLARTHATVTLPSAAALKTLRSLPAGAANRLPFIGFGDPYFSEQQAAEADLAKASQSEPRGLGAARRVTPDLRGIDSADLARLPRLPDTGDELRAVAEALRADPKTSLKLGREANEKNVMTAGLARYRVVAFSTHGLAAGELNGLTQPALALTAPKVAGVDGDGLLTMDKILSLKLDLDWTVLSACNTGTGIGAEAEAASGLGRAFFYAGSRALLVTNWPVDSISARELVSDLFRRHTENSSLSRAEALRQTIVSMIDYSGRVSDGKMLISYAHPLFWAPYSIMGDGGS